MFLVNFIFVVSHLKINPAVHLNTLKAMTSLQSKRKVKRLQAFCTQVAAGLEPGTFTFRAQAASFREIYVLTRVEGATKLNFTLYSCVVVVVVVFSMLFYLSLHFLLIVLRNQFFTFLCFMCFLSVLRFEFDAIYEIIRFRITAFIESLLI